MKIKMALMAFALFLGACGSGDDENAVDASDDDTTATTADDEGTDTSATTSVETTATTAGDTADTAAGGELGGLLSVVFAGAGVEPSEEIIRCVNERDANVDVDPLEASEEEVAAATVAAFACAADELAPLVAADTTPPDGTDAADVECVIAETFRYFGDIPSNEALAALDAETIPQEFRDAVLPVAQAACGLDASQVNAIFDAN